jgi:hypothetical protein
VASTTVTDGEWLPVRSAAARLGLSTFAFRGIAQRAGITIQRRIGHPQVLASQVDALLRNSRISTGRYGRGSVPYGGRKNATEVRHVGLLDGVVQRHGWTDAEVAQAVGVDSDRIARWRSIGVANGYLPALRALAESDTVDPLHIARLLPEGSRRRLVQSPREPESDGWVTDVS